METVEVTPAETEARANGWVPKDEFKGNPDVWKPAETFNEDGKKIAAVQSERNRKLVQEVASMKVSMKEMQDSNFKVIKEVRKESYEKAKAELEAKQEKAFDEGDKEKFKQTKKALDNLKPPEDPKPKTEAGNEISNEYKTWAAENTWYGTDRELTDLADAYGAILQREGTVATESDAYAEIKRRVMNARPDKFQTSPAQSKVEGGSSGGGGSKGGKSYSDLPPDAKAACDRYVGDKLMKREDYVKSYFEGE